MAAKRDRIAPAELRAFVPGISSPVEADDDLVAELAHGLTLAMHAYAEMGFESFNLAAYGAPPGVEGYPLNLRLACRSNLRAFYRSDSTLLERLHWEGAIDLIPETVAEGLELQAFMRNTVKLFGQLVELVPYLNDDLVTVAVNLDDSDVTVLPGGD